MSHLRYAIAHDGLHVVDATRDNASVAFCATPALARDLCSDLNRDERNARIVAIVTAEGTVVQPSAINVGYVVIVNGRTGKDACAKTADEAFDVLIDEEDGR